MSTAEGIHNHPFYKTGLKETDPKKPILLIDEVLTGVTPPQQEDRYTGVVFGLDGNDTYGDCGPTSVDNNRRSTSKVATGTQLTATLEEVFALYRASGNPNFNPNDKNTEDNGVEMGEMCDALMRVGLGGDKPIAFGRAKDMSDSAIERLVAVFGGVLFAVTLEEAQQSQSDGVSPMWTYSKSGVWGGHAIYNGKYKVLGPNNVDAPVISWQKEIGTTDSFRNNQLDEVWILIWPWHLEHPAFLEGVDINRLAEVFKDLTGKELPLPKPSPTPTPTPTPSQADAADQKMWASVEHWTEKQHLHGPTTIPIVHALKEWAAEKGLS